MSHHFLHSLILTLKVSYSNVEFRCLEIAEVPSNNGETCGNFLNVILPKIILIILIYLPLFKHFVDCFHAAFVDTVYLQKPCLLCI